MLEFIDHGSKHISNNEIRHFDGGTRGIWGMGDSTKISSIEENGDGSNFS